jgi:hypothetical protein
MAPANFNDFVIDDDVQEVLESLELLGISDKVFHHDLSIIMFNLLKGVYSLGDITRITGSSFNVLFCVNKEGVCEEYLHSCIKSLGEFIENQNIEMCTLLIPSFLSQKDLTAFVQDLEEIYKECEINKPLAVLTTDFLKQNLLGDSIN